MMPWVAQYLVMKRASIEHNFHTLYAKFIDHLNKHDFTSIVVEETFRNIRVRACLNIHSDVWNTYVCLKILVYNWVYHVALIFSY